MRTSAVLEHFKGPAATARALGIKPPSVAEWGEFPPPLRQLQIERITDGALRAEIDALPPPPAPAGEPGKPAPAPAEATP